MSPVFIIVLVIAESLIILCHWFVSHFIISTFNISSSSGLLYLKIIFFLLSVSFLAAQLLAVKVNNVISRTFYKISAVWMGIFIYLLFSAVIGLFFNQSIGYVLIGVSVIFVIYGVFNANYLRLIHLKIKLPNLPAVWEGKQIVFLGDTHLGQIRNLHFLRKIEKIINRLNPELIIHSGDFYDGVKTDLQALADQLAKIKSRRGTYFVTGNHESFEDPQIYIEPLRRAGINVLMNEKRDLDGLTLIGIDYQSSEKAELYSEILEELELDRAKPSILIKHTPLHLEIPESKGINLVLSGHSHRGQLWPFRYITRLLFHGFDYGLKHLNNLSVYTTSGAGTWGPPLRTFTNSEIVVIELRNGKE